MPGTTRYSATFDRPYEEEEKSDPAANGSRRSRSQSWQANVGMGSRPYTPLGYNNNRPSQRSSSTDSGGAKGAEQIPTRTTSTTMVKTHNNPFQFVKVGSCPLYRKAEEQLKKVKEVKKPEPLEEEEEWQSNLDSWKSRRRKMSEDIFRRQEEIKQFETEEQSLQANSKKIKTFSEMVESRAHRGRTMSLCLISSPLELQQWELENQNKSHLFSEESEENSAVNSEDEGVNERRFQKNLNGSSNGTQTAKNGSAKNKINKLFELGENCSPLKDGIYIDSGLESISSSHRAGDTPDSCSDFSQDSGSSIDCDSPRASGLLHGMNLIEDYNSKSLHHSDSSDSFSNMKTTAPDSSKKKVNGETNRNSAPNGQKETEDFPSSNGCTSKTELLNKEHISRTNELKSAESSTSELSADDVLEKKCGKQEHSIESENEVFVDDFEELSINASASSNQDSGKASNANTERATAKLVSVEISNQKADLSVDSKTSVENVLQEESLNVVFQSSTPKTAVLKTSSTSDTKKVSSASSTKGTPSDVLPVEQIAEEMEKLILQQLEEEERAKELSNKPAAVFEIAPSRKVEPPKEKPPPPPKTEPEVQKAPSLKRVNSTKRIKKEIHKRRSNFLGIENADESLVCDDSLVPPPNALEQILKAEMELDRESMKRLESAAAERLKFDEKDIIEKEREIIATLETEEMQKHLVVNEESSDNSTEDRITKLIEERKRMEKEKAVAETQKLRLAEEKQLKEREEYIRKQEEAIRKERERLRQEQETLQKEREEHRLKLLKEQELLKSSQKPNAPMSRLGPAPPAKPSYSPKLTSSNNNQPSARENVIFTSQSYHGAQNGISSRNGCVDPVHAVVSKQKPVPSQKKVLQNDSHVPHKVPLVKKPSHDSSPESKYNQNHWLIQEAEMRRIAELKERQHSAQFPISQTHLAEDDICSNSRVPVVSPGIAPNQDKLWSYAHPTGILQKPLQHVPSDKVIGIYQHASQPPAKPSRVVPLERPEQILSVSGRKRCSHCNDELGRGAAMIIESLQLYYHIQCFQCCVCQAQLGNGSCGTDVRVRNNKLHCHNCYSNDEAGLKFSQV